MAGMRIGGLIAIVSSFVLALMLTALPVPDWAGVWRPAWVALVLIYWCMAVPERVGVGVGWLVGLLLDVLTGTLLGHHALGLSVVAFVTHKLHQQVRVLPLWQQGISVFALVLIYQLLVLWINGIRGFPVEALAYWASPLTSTVLWPWVFIILRDVRRNYGVA
ncbi:MAG: rod shape-determining protein MreD [Gammaproteobacteria bacterium]|nr:rod shape-determining protein MreD [Gammaproteobacteria bacterium]NIR84219.1 rod shape-determining protein MreD [Gammaproteobacteria bacterium]NIR89689.1 rod shape-determining protein MreD [Gammaproteobacteria bacterium]NIU05377.1 rod shape-determining protein MreD [Gammaproteobacteria bacterium]NIV52323.1 rod shape-determining protein MreD [Gammaproteobacteria bacterium]